MICWQAPRRLPLVSKRCPPGLDVALPWGIAVAQESSQKEVSVGRRSRSRYTHGQGNAASELNCQNLFTRSLPLFPCSFRLRKASKSSAGSPETTLKSDFARQEPTPLSLIKKYPAPKRKLGTAVAPAALPCRVLGCGRKAVAARMPLSLSPCVQRSLPKRKTWAGDLEQC